MTTIKTSKAISIIAGAVLAIIAVFGQTRPLLYAAVDVERASAHATEMAALNARIDKMKKSRDEQMAEFQDQLQDNRQWTACLLWKVAARDCGSFRIPALTPRPK